MDDPLWARMGVKAAILRNHRLLLLRRCDDLDLFPGLWDLPGGGMQNSDLNLEEALAREVLEETSYRVRVGPVLDVSFQRIKVRAEPRFPSAVTCFLCSTRSRAAPRLDPQEHSEFAWVTWRELRKLAVVPRLRRAMETALLAHAHCVEQRVGSPPVSGANKPPLPTGRKGDLFAVIR